MNGRQVFHNGLLVVPNKISGSSRQPILVSRVKTIGNQGAPVSRTFKTNTVVKHDIQMTPGDPREEGDYGFESNPTDRKQPSIGLFGEQSPPRTRNLKAFKKRPEQQTTPILINDSNFETLGSHHDYNHTKRLSDVHRTTH